jgi:hypothetical protein
MPQLLIRADLAPKILQSIGEKSFGPITFSANGTRARRTGQKPGWTAKLDSTVSYHSTNERASTMKELSGAAALLCVAVGLSAQPPVAPAAARLAVVNANLVNVRDGRVTPNATIVIRNGRMESIASAAAPAGTQVRDLKGK